MIEEDGECYVPLQTINDLLVSQNYVFVVFNGVELIASSYSASLLDEMYEAPTGTIFTISSPIQISTLKNGSLYNADQGIVPDFTISKYDTFYDREKLVDFIHQLP